jgi:hypothetical protein
MRTLVRSDEIANMRNQKGLSLVEASLILVVIIIVGSVGYSRQKAGKSIGNAGGTSESGVKQIRQQKGWPEKTDETANWVTYVSTEDRFSLRHPKNWAVGPAKPHYCYGSLFFTAGASPELVGECGTCYVGQIYVYSTEGNKLSNYKLRTGEYPYLDITSRKVTVDKIEGARETGTAMDHLEQEFAMAGFPDGTKVVIYLFYAHGRTYVAQYAQRIGDPDISRDFDLMITKTLKFSN